MKPKELDWEKEFEIKYGRNSGRLTFYNEQKYYWNNKFYDEVKDFISQTLTQQRTELLEEIKNMINSCYWIGGTNFVVNGKQEKMISKAEITEKFTNLLNKKDE